MKHLFQKLKGVDVKTTQNILSAFYKNISV